MGRTLQTMISTMMALLLLMTPPTGENLHIDILSFQRSIQWCKQKILFTIWSFGFGLQNVLDQEMMKYWDDFYNRTDGFTDGWLSSAHALLEQTSSRNKVVSDDPLSSGSVSASEKKCQHVNVLVTSGSFIPKLVKCLLFRLDDLILHDNVYSSWEVGKLQCFEWIKERFGDPKVRFCVIGDGMEECDAAQRMNWPFIKIDLPPNGPHRFPGLTMRMVGHYIDVIYGTSDSEDEE